METNEALIAELSVLPASFAGRLTFRLRGYYAVKHTVSSQCSRGPSRLCHACVRHRFENIYFPTTARRAVPGYDVTSCGRDTGYNRGR